MSIKNSFYLLSAIGCLALFSVKARAMEEDAISSYRVQTFSIKKSQGTEAGHQEFERQAKIAPSMKNYAAYLAQEENSSWIRGQLKCSSEANAKLLAQELTKKLTTGPLVVVPYNVKSGQ